LNGNTDNIKNLGDEMMAKGCPYCLLPGGKGIGPGIGGIFETDEEFIEHLEMEHDLVVKRPDETDDEAFARVKSKNPRIGTDDCRCPACLAKRRSDIAIAWNLMEKVGVSL